MDKTFDEAIAGIRKAERGVEVREDIAQGMEYVKQYAEEVTGQQQAALQAAQTAARAASTATKKAAAAAESESTARTSAAEAAQSAQSASADAKSAGSSAASAKAEADRAAAIVRTDKTLSVEGAPADGKAVGDALKGVISADAVKTLIADALAEDHAKIKFWISEDPTSPAALFGGTWEQIASERVLMGASYAHAAGTTVEAGLPNITGSVVPKLTNIYNSFISESGATMTGAFYNTGVFSPYGGADASVTNSVPKDLYFDASRSNSIYGRSSTVQPAAYYVHIWRRVA
jgi:hypothetical protein|nr:MAG TPA: baseplate protein [Caudoviricetes sp.]